MAGKRVGILGGTFDPIHLGHMLIAENAYAHFNLDEVLFVPVGIPHNPEKVVLDPKTRLAMTGISIEDNCHFALSTIEADKDTVSYTYETIAELKKKNPNNTYFLIVGADSLMHMDSWECPEKIFSEVSVLVAERIGITSAELNAKIEEYRVKYNADIKQLPINCIDFSSSTIRKMVKEGRSIRYMVHYKVIEYINKNHIYMDEEEK